MPNFIETGTSWLGERLKDAAGKTVTVKQGTTTLTEVVAAVSMQSHEVEDYDAHLTTVRSYDWTFVTADLDGLEIRRGCLITEDATGEVYECMPIAGLRAVEPLDTSWLLTLVRTKRVNDDG